MTLPRDWIIFSSIDWSRNWQIHQHLATSLVEAGHRVLFIENTGVRTPRATSSDFRRIRHRLMNWLRSTSGFRDERDSLTLFSPLVLPFPYFGPAILLNRFWMTWVIGKWMRVNRFHDPVVITFLPTPMIQGVIDALDPVASIYYCANDMSGGSSGAKDLRVYEDQYLAKADAVFCISHALQERANQFNARVFMIPGGVDVAKFEAGRHSGQAPADLNEIPLPRIGYVGTVGAVFDQMMVCAAARALPAVHFVLVGPESVDTAPLRSEPNIHLLGPRPHAQMPAYINAFDVTVIPYIRNTFTDSVYACKLNEYLALGKPVVTTNLREMRLYAERYPDVIEVVEGIPEFIAAIQAALNGEHDADAPDRRVRAARENSWEQRFADIMNAVSETIALTQSRQTSWQERLRGVLRRARARALKVAISVGVAYGVIFYTPLVWWAGQALVVSQPRVTAADAVVVFSGDGESGYNNATYQKRAIDALKLYRSGYAKTLVLSSGKGASISEAAVVRALLLQYGVPAGAILTNERMTNGTFANVRVTASLLQKHNFSSVLFVTAPYHSRRALLVWQKVAPELKLQVFATADTPSEQPMWTVSFNTARVIAYEYLAIIYYWFRGWV